MRLTLSLTACLALLAPGLSAAAQAPPSPPS